MGPLMLTKGKGEGEEEELDDDEEYEKEEEPPKKKGKVIITKPQKQLTAVFTRRTRKERRIVNLCLFSLHLPLKRG